MSLSLNLGKWNKVFAVPSEIVDRHLKLASESQLKVILYLLAHAGENEEDDQMAKKIGISESELHHAIEFWVERGLIGFENGEVCPAVSDVKSDQPLQNVPKEKSAELQKHTAVSRAVRPDSATVSKLLRRDTSLAGLMEEAQTVLKKPLSPGDTAVLVMLYDTFGLPCDVLAMLLHYSASVGSANMRAIERLGIDWSDKGIYTVDAAEKEIDRISSYREAWGRVSSLLGIRNIGNPTKSQTEHADRWLNVWHFSDNMITEAYERCVNTKGEYNLRYINAILSKWYDKRIFTPEALARYEAGMKKPIGKTKSKKGSVFSAENASFDLNRYEKQSLFDD